MFKLLRALLLISPLSHGATSNIPGLGGGGSPQTLTYTPTIVGFGSPSNVRFRYWISGDRLYVRGTFTSGTLDAALGTISLPGSNTINASKMEYEGATSGNCPSVGDFRQPNATMVANIVSCTDTSTSVVYTARIITVNSSLAPDNANSQFFGSVFTHVSFDVPINL
jgi:hypothetical protein